jgi:predicted glycogen debranching enzyme
MRDGPFPLVETGGELGRAAEVEWLHTNGAGAYAMSSVALMHTRRTHGILVVALDAPLDRHVMMSHGEVSLEVDGKVHRLSTHQFPNIAPTPGYRYLRQFSQDPIPRWVYEVGDGQLERTLALVRGKNAVVLGYLWRGASPAKMSLKPLMPFRRIDTLMREHGAMVQKVQLRQGEVEIQPMSHLPPVFFRHRGMFVGSPDWWRRFEYTKDRQNGLDYYEDMWTPGTFEFELRPGEKEYLLVSVGETLTAPPGELMRETMEWEAAQDPGPSRPNPVRALSVAAEQFCATRVAMPSTLAGYPLLEPINRDTLVSLSGLYLTRDRVIDAQNVLRTLLRARRYSLITLTLPVKGRGKPAPSPETTLWLFEVARELIAQCGPQDPFVRRELYPALARAFARLRKGHRFGVWLTPEGLLANGLDNVGLTWMDAKVGDVVQTPRRGLAVEWQALWSKGCETLAGLAEAYGHTRLAAIAEESCQRAREAFRSRFWCADTEYPYDCVSESASPEVAWVDTRVRPNAVLALATDPELFDGWQAACIVGRAREELLTPRGLRSLSPRERGYRAHYEGRSEERDSAYHQGTVWTHLLGAFVRAALRLSPDDWELREELRSYVEAALDDCPVLGQVPQLADGDDPHRPRGCPAQAWSVGELLRSLVLDLSL